MKSKVYCSYSKIISALGDTTIDNFNAIENYQTNVAEYSDTTKVCLIDKTKLDLSKLKEYSFVEQLSILALEDVIKQSGIDLDDEKTLLIISTTKGDVSYLNEDVDKVKLWNLQNTLNEYFTCKNKALLVSNACISALSAINIASRFIENGDYDNVYVLGVDVVNDFVVSGFNSFKSVSKSLCKPYDKNRDGLTLGEACGVILLSQDSDLSENKILIAGGVMTCDANHISAPSRSGECLANAIELSLQNSGIDLTGKSGFLNMHGTGTIYNDEMESRAVDSLKLNHLKLNSLKPCFGHSLGAAGVVEFIIAVEQLAKNVVFGLRDYSESGVPFALNISNKHRYESLDYCIKTASGFGGTNAATLIVKEELYKQKTLSKNDIKIAEISSLKCSNQTMPIDLFLSQNTKEMGLKSIKFMKMDSLSKLGYITSKLLLKDIDIKYTPQRIAIILANSSSSLQSDIKHQQIINQQSLSGASPAVFVYTIANVLAAEIAILHNFKNELNFFIYENKNLDFIESYSKNLIEDDFCDGVLYGWCELFNENYDVDLKFIGKI